MSKKIILLSDGTGNSAGKANKTNVWRMYRALDLQRPGQVAFYDDGVGTQAFLPLKILGGAFGFGLKRNVIELYEFLCRNYRDGDKIYLFGFSRGAWTVRMVVGFIHCCGIIRKKMSEEELDKEANKRYKEFRTQFKRGATKFINKGLDRFSSEDDKKARQGVPVHNDAPPIEFIGVWDTVSAYGMPIDELTWLWDFFFYPLSFPGQKLSKLVKHARHALAIDDERRTFHPVLWDEEGETRDRIKQVWFAGAHSNVGGGYPKDELALVTLDWMMTEVETLADKTARLRFIPGERERTREHAYVHGMLYDSRRGLSTYYRLKPRKLEVLCNKGVSVKTPEIHESVFERIKGGVTPYAPLGLPKTYKVYPRVNLETKSAAARTRTVTLEQEKSNEIDDRLEAMNTVWRVVTERIGLYWLFLVTTFLLVLFPIIKPNGDLVTTGEAGDYIDTAFSTLGNLVPWYLESLAESWRAYPLLFFGLVGFLLVLMLIKKSALARTKNRSEKAWAHLKIPD